MTTSAEVVGVIFGPAREGEYGVDVAHGAPGGFVELDRADDRVAEEHRALPAGGDDDAEMPGGVSGVPFTSPGGEGGDRAVVVQAALTQIGSPYVWGGASPAGFDCSGLTMWVYAQLGITLDHYTGSQWTAGPHVSRADLQPGDLVFFYPDIGHVGLYIGNNLMVDAPDFGEDVPRPDPPRAEEVLSFEEPPPAEESSPFGDLRPLEDET